MQGATRQSRTPGRRQATNAYVLSWVAVAMGGLAYLGVAAARPDLLSSILPIADQQQDQASAGRIGADLADEVTTLRKWVHDLQHEVAATKSTLQEQLSLTQALATRMGAAEERLPVVREIRSEPAQKGGVQRLGTPASARPEAPPAARPQPQASAVIDLPPLQSAAAGLKVLNPETQSQIATGSLPSASQAPPAAVAKAPATGKAVVATPRGIEIGSADLIDTLKARWGEVRQRSPDAVAALGARYRLASDGRANPFTLLAGPFTSTDEAVKACATLRSRGVSCRVSSFSGSALQ